MWLLVAWCVAAVLGAGVVFLLYRMFVYPLVDPLRAFPGPTHGRVFGAIGEVIKEQTCAPQMRWVENHGKTILYRKLFNVPSLLTVDPNIIKRVLVSESKKYGKPERQMKMLRQALGNGLVTSSGVDHAKHRALISQHFRFQKLKEVFPVFVRTAHRLADHWEQQWADTGKELDVIGAMAKYTLDVIGLSAFGYNFDATAHPSNALSVAFNEMLPKLDPWMVLAFAIPPSRHVLQWLGLGPFKRRAQAIATVRAKVAEIVGKRVEHANKHGNDAIGLEKTLLDIMIHDRYKDGTKMTPVELADQTMTFLLAGHETTSNALTWTWLLLAKHPHVEKKLRAEILAALPDGDSDEQLTADSLARMPYLWAVCQESLRLYPPVPITSRVATQNDEWAIDGKKYFIPKGAQVFLMPYVLQHQPELWEDPEVFRPERWHTDASMTTRTRPKPFTFMPFLFGDRSCIGQRFAVMEMQASLAVLLRRFALRRLPGAAEPKRKLTVTMKPSPNLMMTVHRAAVVANTGVADAATSA